MPALWLLIVGFYNSIPDWLKKALAAVIVLAIVFVAGDIRGARIAHAQCEAQAKRAQTAADDQDLAAEREGRAQDLQITNDLTQQTKVDNDTIEALKAKLASRPTAAQCLYDKSTADPDGDSRRLRH